jgi:histidine triad (HIT) family protein
MTHAPRDYDCPFCRVVRGEFGGDLWTAEPDVVHRDEHVCAFVSPGQFSTAPSYPGHVLVVPVEHHENLYDMPDALLARVATLVRRVAIAFTRLGADGTSTRQHNEPAGNQDVWHFHEHVFPRYVDDRLYHQERHRPPAERRAAQAEGVGRALADVLADLPLEAG